METVFESCLLELKGAEDQSKFQEKFTQIYINFGPDLVHEDDILYFVKDDENQKPEVIIRRIPADGCISELDFKPAWKETLYLNLICHLKCIINIELISDSGTVKMSQSVATYPSPNDMRLGGDEKGVDCRLCSVFPLIIFPVQDPTSLKRLPVQQEDSLNISIRTGTNRVLFSTRVPFGKIASEFHQTLKKRRHVTLSLDEERKVNIKLANCGSIILTAAPFFLEDVRMGVRSAIYSLVLRRLPRSPCRYICRPASLSLHWQDLIDYSSQNG